MTEYEQSLYQQFSQEAIRRRVDSDRLLEKASDVARGNKAATDSIEQATSNKRKQLIALKQFANEVGCWFPDYTIFGIFLERGGENEVYYNPFTNSVFKLNDFTFAGDDTLRLFDRIKVHNVLFANVYYSLIGFAKNSKGLFCAILEQGHIQALREATEKEIAEYFAELGFTSVSSDEFHNNLYEIFDAVPNNVLMGTDDKLYFFDTQIRII